MSDNQSTITIARHCPEHRDSPAEHPACRACAYFDGFRSAEARIQGVIEAIADDTGSYIIDGRDLLAEIDGGDDGRTR